MLALSILFVSLFILLVATYTDLKTLEVPDWINYGGIAAGLGIHAIFSLQQWAWSPIISSAIGLSIGFALACVMYYAGQWGGGDAKLLMAMGALIGFEMDKFGFGASFLINLVFMGAAWGFIYTTYLAIKNGKQFLRTFSSLRHHKPYARLRLMTIVSTSILLAFAFVLATFRLELVVIAALTYSLTHLTIFVKSVELSSMHQWITPDKLTEGDWLVHAVKVGNKQVIPGKLGLESKDLKTLQSLHKNKKLDKVLVKYGVPFVPAFLFAFVITLFFNNLLLAVFTLF